MRRGEKSRKQKSEPPGWGEGVPDSASPSQLQNKRKEKEERKKKKLITLLLSNFRETSFPCAFGGIKGFSDEGRAGSRWMDIRGVSEEIWCEKMGFGLRVTNYWFGMIR